MSTVSKSRKPLQVASGTFRWLLKPDDLAENGVIVINGTPYLLSPVRGDKPRLVKDRPIVGWKLAKADGQVYDLHFADKVPTCDCPDWVFGRDRAATPQERCCKHLNCLAKALPLVGLPLHQIVTTGPAKEDDVAKAERLLAEDRANVAKLRAIPKTGNGPVDRAFEAAADEIAQRVAQEERAANAKAKAKPKIMPVEDDELDGH